MKPLVELSLQNEFACVQAIFEKKASQRNGREFRAFCQRPNPRNHFLPLVGPLLRRTSPGLDYLERRIPAPNFHSSPKTEKQREPQHPNRKFCVAAFLTDLPCRQSVERKTPYTSKCCWCRWSPLRIACTFRTCISRIRLGTIRRFKSRGDSDFGCFSDLH